MTSACRLHFLRPWALGALPAPNPVYLRFYKRTRSAVDQQGRRMFSASGRECSSDTAAAHAPVQWAPASPPTSEAPRAAKSSPGRYPRMGAVRAGVTAPPTRIPDLRARYHGRDPDEDDPTVAIQGRIYSVRRASSRLVFLDVVGEFERVQVMLNAGRLVGSREAGTGDQPAVASAEEFRRLSEGLLQRGVFVLVEGRAMRTKSGELTVLATAFPRALTPNDGFIPPRRLVDDAATVGAARHLDLLANRASLDALRLRSEVMRCLRDYLQGQGFLEVQTPILAEHASGAAARPFLTESAHFPGQPLAMRVAPELWLKRLVVGGFERVFEMGPCFRNEGLDQTHNPEFTMCEFYEAFATLDGLVARTEELVGAVSRMIQAQSGGDNAWRAARALPTPDAAKFEGPFARVEFVPALQAALGFELPDLEAETAFEQLKDLLLLRRQRGVVQGPEEDELLLSGDAAPASLPKLLDRLAAAHLEPASRLRPTFITHHPACMSPLAKAFRCPATGQLVAARAELFVDGYEVANMYEEENDPDAQAAKFVAQERLRRMSPVDDHEGGEGGGGSSNASYVEALRAGLPPTGGWGCGIERLVMLFSGAPRIRDVLAFGTLRNVIGVSRARGLPAGAGSSVVGGGEEAAEDGNKSEGSEVK